MNAQYVDRGVYERRQLPCCRCGEPTLRRDPVDRRAICSTCDCQWQEAHR